MNQTWITFFAILLTFFWILGSASGITAIRPEKRNMMHIIGAILLGLPLFVILTVGGWIMILGLMWDDEDKI